jgi:hypothetical protein
MTQRALCFFELHRHSLEYQEDDSGGYIDSRVLEHATMKSCTAFIYIHGSISGIYFCHDCKYEYRHVELFEALLSTLAVGR